VEREGVVVYTGGYGGRGTGQDREKDSRFSYSHTHRRQSDKAGEKNEVVAAEAPSRLDTGAEPRISTEHVPCRRNDDLHRHDDKPLPPTSTTSTTLLTYRCPCEQDMAECSNVILKLK